MEKCKICNADLSELTGYCAGESEIANHPHYQDAIRQIAELQEKLQKTTRHVAELIDELNIRI